MATVTTGELTNKNVLVRNIKWNFLAQGLPLIIAFLTIPRIINGIGTDRFGLLTLVWAIIGYSSVLDLGLGRALTQLVSKKLGNNDTEDLQTIIWTALFTIAVLGIIGAAIISFFVPFIAEKALKVPMLYLRETQKSIYLLLATLPLLIVAIGIKGVLESYQKFAVLSILRVPTIIFNYIGPLFIIPFTKDLSVIVSLLVFGRLITFAGYVIACAKAVDKFFEKFKLDFGYIKPLLSFGGWITVTNILSPLMMYMDRFFISGMISATVVAYYATPFDMVSKMLIIPAAIIGVMFPAFSAEFSSNIERTKRLYYKSIQTVLLLLIIPCLLAIIFAKQGLALWINAGFAEHSYKITQFLIIGCLLSSLNYCPFSLIQASGRSDISAKLHLIEFPVYLFLLLFFIKKYSILGAAFAWFIRISLDFIAHYYIAFMLIKKKEASQT